jgi:hypothetical protein
VIGALAQSVTATTIMPFAASFCVQMPPRPSRPTRPGVSANTGTFARSAVTGTAGYSDVVRSPLFATLM